MAVLSMSMAGRKPCMTLLTKAVYSWNNVLIWSFNKAHGFFYSVISMIKLRESKRQGMVYFFLCLKLSIVTLVSLVMRFI